MILVIKLLIGLICFLHFYFFIFETFLWVQIGPKVFRKLPRDLFPKTKAMMQNQGVYNLFLALGLLWTFFIEEELWYNNIALFFLFCVVIAGLVGSITVDRKIFFIQALPAIVVLLLISLF